jgi:mRNA interferase MazF
LGIHQGDIYWVQLENPDDSEPRMPHLHVVIQLDRRNQTNIATVAVCELTTNLKRVSVPGNVLLEAGEASLPKQSVVEVSKVFTIDKAELGAYIGTLSERRVDQILAGIRFVRTSFL